MTTVFVVPSIAQIIQSKQKARNGLVPDSQYHNAIIGQANNVAAFRGKDLFSSSGNLGIATAGGAGERVRWRFAFHTGPFCRDRACKAADVPGVEVHRRERLRAAQDHDDGRRCRRDRRLLLLAIDRRERRSGERARQLGLR
jgi:hypothetical protein